MDVALRYCDYKFFTPYVYPSTWAESDPWRQFLSLNVIVNLGGTLLYLITASLSFMFIYDKRLLKHPQILEVGKIIYYWIALFMWLKWPQSPGPNLSCPTNL